MKLRDYFSYTASEKKGFLFLLILLGVTISFYWVLPFFYSADRFDFSKFEEDVDRFLSAPKENEVIDSYSYESEPIKDSLFNFDPNRISREEWGKLGFSEKQIKSILSYRNKYGFSSKSDVKKLYVVSDEKYNELEPFIELNNKEQKKKIIIESSVSTKKEKFLSSSLKDVFINSVININKADTTELKSLRGIGPSFAKRIVKYRNLLGGFYSLTQLSEVYGLPIEVIEDNKSRLMLDTTLIVKIAINSCEAKDLKNHPYINWNLANSIVQIRKNHGDYKILAEIKKSDLVNDEIYRKIAPYLKIE